MKKDIYLGMRPVNVNLDQVQVFVTLDNVAKMVNVVVNVKY